MSKTKVHTRYRNKNGDIIPGVTTILSVLNKPALMHWAWQQGCEGKDYRKVRDQKADIGTIAHAMIMAHHKNIKFDTAEYAPADIDRAENAFLKYLDWEKEHPLTPIAVEEPVICEEYQYGGTPDLVAKSNGDIIHVDYKTGKGIYPEMSYQLAAYEKPLKEKYDISNSRILRIGRDETEGFEEKVYTDLMKEWLIFKHCREIYNLQKEVRNG